MRKIEREPQGSGKFCPGQDLVAAGIIAKSGVKAAVKLGRGTLQLHFTEDFICEIEKRTEEDADLTPELLKEYGATEWEYVDQGGIFEALWNLSGAYEQGFHADLLKFPVRQEIIEVCECFDLNPYRLRSGNCYIAAADHGYDLVRALSEKGITASVIGKIEKGIARKIEGPAGTGFLSRPEPDEIEKLPEAAGKASI